MAVKATDPPTRMFWVAEGLSVAEGVAGPPDLSAINIPPLPPLVKAVVTVPLPVEPAVAFIAQAAPTEVAVPDAKSYNSVKAPEYLALPWLTEHILMAL